MAEALSISTLLLLGIAALMSAHKSLGWPLTLAAALPTGSLLWMLIVIIAGLLGGEVGGRELVVGTLLLVLVIIAVLWWQRGRDWTTVAVLALFISIVSILVLMLTSFQWDLYHTGDSFMIRDMGKLWLHPSYEFDPAQISELRVFDEPPVKHVLGGYGFLLPSIHSADFINYFRTFTPLFSVSLLASLLILLGRLFPQRRSYSKIIFLGALSLIILSTFFYILNSLYVHTNFMAAGFMTMATLAFITYMQNREEPFFSLGVLMLAAFSFSRVESPFIVLAAVPLILTSHPVPVALIRRWFVPMFILIGLWHVYVVWDLSTIGSSRADLLSPTMALAVSATFLVGAGVLAVWDRISRLWSPVMARIVVYGLVVAGLVSVIFLGGVNELNILLTNAFYYYGAWGGTWFFLALVWLTFPADATDKGIRLIGQLIVVNFMLILIAGVLAGKFRLGWSDSGNRMMLQVFFLAFAGGALRVYPLLFSKTKRS